MTDKFVKNLVEENYRLTKKGAIIGMLAVLIATAGLRLVYSYIDKKEHLTKPNKLEQKTNLIEREYLPTNVAGNFYRTTNMQGR